jgi:hypothetical protein
VKTFAYVSAADVDEALQSIASEPEAKFLDSSKETPHHMLSVNSAELVRLTRRVCGFVVADGSVSGR